MGKQVFNEKLEEDFVGEEAKKLIYLIAAGCMVLITGNKDARNAVINEAIKKVRGTWKSLYIDSDKKYRWDIQKMLFESNGFIGAIFGIMPRERVLFVEDARFLTEKNFKMIRYFYDENNLKAVVIASDDSSITKILPEAIKNRIGNRIIKLRG